MTDLLQELTARGLVHDVTPGLAARLAQGPITGYVGFDPTADSLHVGNLVPVMALAWLQITGGRPLVLVGGGTGLVGDPSGKRAERPMLDPETVQANTAAIRAQLTRFLTFEPTGELAPERATAAGLQPARLYNNAEWLAPLGLMDFLRETGKHFSIGYMLQKESVRSRLETGISFTEFSYMLVQAHDYAHLHRTEGCELQLGGSDQWGNITAGIELVGRKYGAEVHGLTLPLLTTASGTKFGKSEDGNIWLDPAKTSPYRFYQFWLNQDDQDMERLLRTFSFRRRDVLAELLAGHAGAPERREAQRALAEEMTERVHGVAELARAQAASAILFGGSDIRDADAATLAVVAAEAPSAPIAAHELGTMSLAEALVRVGLAASKGEARRGISGSGYSLNGMRIADDRAITGDDVLSGGYVVLQRGKRNYAVLVVT